MTIFTPHNLLSDPPFSKIDLSITRSLLQLMGSELKLESKEGEGSQFFFHLEQKIGREETPGAEAAVQETDEQHAAMKDAHILLVEDSAINRMLMQQYLEECWDISAHEGHDGRQAVEKAKEEAYDLILMDIRMPEMDGREATRQIRRFNTYFSSSPIVALTTEDQAENKLFDAMVSKPFDPMQLKNTISRLMQQETEKVSEPTSPDGTPREILPSRLLKEKLQLNLEKTETTFLDMPSRKHQFFEMSVRSLNAFRSKLPLLFAAYDVQALEHVMHKERMLFNIFELDQFYDDIQRARCELQAGKSPNELSSQLSEIDDGLQEIIKQLEQKVNA
jgi:CheY-like chemotaxis protein